MHVPGVLTASLPAAIVVSALMIGPVHAALERGNSVSPQAHIEACSTRADESLGGCAAANSIARKPGRLELAFDQTTPPKKGKKRKGTLRVTPVAPAETGIMGDNARYQRSHGPTATGISVKPPLIQTQPGGLIDQIQDPTFTRPPSDPTYVKPPGG